MLKLFVGTLLIVFAAQSVQAQVSVDISKITCEQFNVLEKQDWVAIWLSGFYHGQKEKPVLEINVFEENVRKYRALADNQTISNGASWRFTRAASQSSYRIRELDPLAHPPRKIFVKFEHPKNLADDPATGQCPLLGVKRGISDPFAQVVPL
jgi:hypothetical protein